MYHVKNPSAAISGYTYDPSKCITILSCFVKFVSGEESATAK